MAIDTKAIQKFISNDEQRLSLLSEYNPTEHLLTWQAYDKAKGKHVEVRYYPAGWRLYELRLRYPTAKFDINIILMDQERNFCVVQAKLFVGPDYETADIRSIAHKQGPLTDLDRVETKAKARAARDLGISTELALDFDDVPEGEPVQNEQPAQRQQPRTRVTEERPAQQSQSRQVAPQLDNESKARLNSLYDRATALRLLKTSDAKHFLMLISKILGETIEQPQSLTKDKVDKVELYLVNKEQEQASEKVQETPKQEVESDPAKALKARLLATLERAKALNQFETVEGDAVKNVAAFLKFAGSVLNANVTHTSHLTVSRLDTIEKYLDAKDAA